MRAIYDHLVPLAATLPQTDGKLTNAGQAQLAHIISEKIRDDLLRIVEPASAGEHPKTIVIVGGIQINLEPVEHPHTPGVKVTKWKKESKHSDVHDFFLVTYFRVINPQGNPTLESATLDSFKQQFAEPLEEGKKKKKKEDKKEKEDKKDKKDKKEKKEKK